jgi:sortase A
VSRRGGRSALRAVARFAASVLMVSGVLLIADAGLTIAWKEPITSFLAQRQQAKLKHQLERPSARVLEKHPLPGDAIGKLTVPSLHASYYVVQGTSASQLTKGPGHYRDTRLPGERGTVGIAGHRTTYLAPFRHIDKLRRGQPIILDMTYGRFVYRVQKTIVVSPNAVWVKRRVGYDRLMMSACHPPYSAAKRIIAFSRFVRREPGRLKRT